MANKANEVARGLDKLKADYRYKLPGRLAEIASLWADIQSAGWQGAVARQIHTACHHLAGTGQIFGYASITVDARRVEQLLNIIFDRDDPASSAQQASLDTAIQTLVAEGRMPDSRPKRPKLVVQSSESAAAASVPPSDSEVQAKRQSFEPAAALTSLVQPLSILPIYVVDDDMAFADYLTLELALQGYDARAVYSLADLDEQLAESTQAPGAILMDVIFPDATTGGIDLINRYREEQILKAPVIFMSASDSFDMRLEIVRAGGEAFFVKPFDVSVVLEKLETLVGDTNPDPLRILLLDDDEFGLEVFCEVLESVGLETRGITEPTQIIENVLEFNPDLVILDMHMPKVNGMEVAQVLRQHDSCSDLPLLFLSAETNPRIREAALNIGVDDFLTKPVSHEYLISAVANRAQRARAATAKMSRDSLTRLLVHNEIKNKLADELSLAVRHSRNLCYLILDLDKFKEVNDTHGHLTGDNVIKSLAGLLRRSFRRSDVLGRYGGEEFVVIMPETSAEDAAIVLDRVRQEFSEISHRSELGHEAFFTTFSAGISCYPDFTDSNELQTRADLALYEAKNTGRNKICLAEA